MAPVLDFTWVSACLFKALEETGVGSCVLLSFPCCPASGEGRDNGRERAVGELQGEGTAFL